MQMTPKQIVQELDRYIIGQSEAKRAVAVALRNRYRRMRLPEEMREEVTPKNILMVGPTGVGKTEIARRLAKLVEAPFVKVEATKFTEVGYVGRDVESIIRDLMENALRQVKERMSEEVRFEAMRNADERILDALMAREKQEKKPRNYIEELLTPTNRQENLPPEEEQRRQSTREQLRSRLLAGELEGEVIEIEIADNTPGQTLPGTDMSMNDMLGSIMPPKKKHRRLPVVEARRLLQADEADKLVDEEEAIAEALRACEQDGIVFIDEIDKVAGRSQGMGGPDVSREGVQRDILPIVEGSVVNTKYGPIKTDHMLFIAAGAFHVAKVTDLIPELQGRFPIKAELKPLTREDFRQILTQPDNALIKQYQALLRVDGVELEFEDSALDVMADRAVMMNEMGENIGARRLHTLIEMLLDEVAFEADGSEMRTVTVDKAYVEEHLRNEEVRSGNLSKYLI